MTNGPEFRVSRAKAKRPEHYRRIDRNSNLRRLYGISLSEYEQMLEDQGGVCALCGEPPRRENLSVDHDHATGRIRGLVHKHCNNVIASVEGDLHDKALAYLERQAN